jgi:hypothetical protein
MPAKWGLSGNKRLTTRGVLFVRLFALASLITDNSHAVTCHKDFRCGRPETAPKPKPAHAYQLLHKHYHSSNFSEADYTNRRDSSTNPKEYTPATFLCSHSPSCLSGVFLLILATFATSRQCLRPSLFRLIVTLAASPFSHYLHRSSFSFFSHCHRTDQRHYTSQPSAAQLSQAITMAAIKGFTEAQNASLAHAEVGNLILVDQNAEQRDDDDENDSDSEGENESDDGGNEDGGDDDDNDNDEQSDSDDEESESESGAITPRATGVQGNHTVVVNTDHAEHIEDVSRVDSASPDTNQYRMLRPARDSEHDNTDQHLVTVYLVVKVTKNSKGAVDDLSLVPLEYSAYAGVSPDTFQLYGKQCVPSFYTGGTTDQSSQSEKEFISIRDLPGGGTLEFTVSPQGDLVRSVLFEDECPACDNGWLDCITRLGGMVKDYTIPTSLPNEPTVCPSCIGIELMKEHQDLRAELEAFSRISDFGAIVAFHGRLAARRSELDYEFEQFDER